MEEKKCEWSGANLKVNIVDNYSIDGLGFAVKRKRRICNFKKINILTICILKLASTHLCVWWDSCFISFIIIIFFIEQIPSFAERYKILLKFLCFCYKCFEEPMEHRKGGDKCIKIYKKFKLHNFFLLLHL